MARRHRGKLDETLANMFSNQTYSNTYLFYAHMIGQCSIVLRDDLPAAAGVSFVKDHYKLYINPTMFDEYNIDVRLGILKHEMLHILNDHVHRAEDRDKTQWNYATDCAINQLIDRNHLPSITQKDIDQYNLLLKEGKIDSSVPAPVLGETAVIYPDTYPVKVGENWTSEQYYEALKSNSKPQENEQSCSKCGGSGQTEQSDGSSCECDRCNGTGKEPGGNYGEGSGKLVDDHGTWNESKGGTEMQKTVTKKMIESSIRDTKRSKSSVPAEAQEYLDLFSTPPQVSWRKQLRNITGNKKVNSRRTIMRSDRRFPKREDLRGKTKDRMFDLTVIVDVSGSMQDDDIMTGLNEIHHICKLTKTTMNLIQVGAVVHKVQKFDKNTKLFERGGAGGTIMYSAIEYIKEHKIPTDACILITDGWIEDVSAWNVIPKFKMMFLTVDHDIPGVENIKHFTQFHLTKEL